MKELKYFTFSEKDIYEYVRYHTHKTFEYYEKKYNQYKQKNNFKDYLRLLKNKIRNKKFDYKNLTVDIENN